MKKRRAGAEEPTDAEASTDLKKLRIAQNISLYALVGAIAFAVLVVAFKVLVKIYQAH